MFCPKCGSRVADDSGFCGECGAQMNPRVSQTQQAPEGSQTPQVQEAPYVAQQTYGYPKAPIKQKFSRKTARIVALGAGVAVLVAAIIVVYNFFFAPYALDEERFPDANMRAIIVSQLDPDHDGFITRDEAAAVQTLEIDGASSITGLEIFPNLYQLTLKGDALMSANLEGCTALQILNASGCTHLSSIVLGNMPALNTLDLSDCSIADLDITGAPELTTAKLSGDPIYTLDLANNTKLAQLECDDAVTLENLDSTPLHEYWVVETFKSTGSSSPWLSYSLSATYDDRGNLTKLVNANSSYGTSTYTYEYDDQDRCTTNKVDFDGITTTWTISYDDRSSMTQAISSSYAYGYNYQDREIISYNDRGLPSEHSYSVDQGGGTVERFTYDSAGNLSSMDFLEFDEKFTIVNDDAGRMTSISVMPYSGSSYNYQVSYDSAGRITSFVCGGSSNAYTQKMEYGSDGKLVNATRQVTGSSDSNSQYASVSSTKFEYDSHGLLTNVVPTRSGSGVSIEYSVDYKRILTTRETHPNCHFLDLSNPLDPLVNEQFYSLDNYVWERTFPWQGSMQNIMSKVSTSSALD